MKILAIETSCDETAVAILDAQKTTGKNGGGISFTVLGNALFSQAKLHEQYGGVYPTLARREHEENLVPLLIEALKEAKMLRPKKKEASFTKQEERELLGLLHREETLRPKLQEFFENYDAPKIDALAVTFGPGLEPALWVGINFAQALGKFWGIPLYPQNHMEGHIFSSMLEEKKKLKAKSLKLSLPSLPTLALLISGGHTELVLMKKLGTYSIVGQTRDDAVGEAFDKAARVLGLPYPGGPEISKLAEEARKEFPRESVSRPQPSAYPLPRPMINSKDFDFSFSGLKTSVLYTVKKINNLTDEIKKQIAQEFENAVSEVLLSKSLKALEKTKAKTLVLGGGVSANKKVRESFTHAHRNCATLGVAQFDLFLPPYEFTTDNAIMIGVVASVRIFYTKQRPARTNVRANGNLSF
ncbi:MAG: tRNA (adenosine(37)-N6)-threonylcarbamoyltransferase complex transferase subunit TsaD [Patescibacteria group bacterium]